MVCVCACVCALACFFSDCASCLFACLLCAGGGESKGAATVAMVEMPLTLAAQAPESESAIPPTQFHAQMTQIPTARHSTSSYQGHGVDEPEALELALQRSALEAPAPSTAAPDATSAPAPDTEMADAGRCVCVCVCALVCFFCLTVLLVCLLACGVCRWGGEEGRYPFFCSYRYCYCYRYRYCPDCYGYRYGNCADARCRSGCVVCVCACARVCVCASC